MSLLISNVAVAELCAFEQLYCVLFIEPFFFRFEDSAWLVWIWYISNSQPFLIQSCAPVNVCLATENGEERIPGLLPLKYTTEKPQQCDLSWKPSDWFAWCTMPLAAQLLQNVYSSVLNAGFGNSPRHSMGGSVPLAEAYARQPLRSLQERTQRVSCQ